MSGPVTAAWQPEVGGIAWAYARHYWREVRVLEIKGKTVVLAYRLVTGRIKHQKLRTWNLRLERPVTRGVVKTLQMPVPSLEQVEAYMKEGR